MASRRQLSELLEEKEEPFLLESYLHENGCSSKRLRRLSSQGFRRRGITIGFLRSILTKIVRGKPFSRALNWDGKPMEGGRLSFFSCFSREFGGDNDRWKCMEMEEEDSSKQLSPVSVFQFSDHIGFKEENQSWTSSSDSPREAPEICLLPHYNKANNGRQLLLDCVRPAEERACEWCLTPEIKAEAIHKKLLSDIGGLTKLVGSDVTEYSKEWSHFRAEVTELGVEIEAAILEEIIDDTILEIFSTHCTLTKF